MLKNISNLACVSLASPPPWHFKQYSATLASSDSKSMRVHVRRIYSKIVFYVISSTYIIKEIEKLVSCVYGVIMHSGNVGRILEKRGKHSATPRVLHASLVFSEHSPRACLPNKPTRLVFYFLNISSLCRFALSNMSCAKSISVWTRKGM